MDTTKNDEVLQELLKDANLKARREPILNEREKTHGSFATTAYVSQTLKYHYRANLRTKLNSIQHEALDLIMMKVARILSGNPNEADHWADIAGYAKLAEESCADSLRVAHD